MRKVNLGTWIMSSAIAIMLTVSPYAYYRHSYTQTKRLRPIVTGQVYRSGCMTAVGFRETIQKYHIKTVINLMEENQDPELPENCFNSFQRTRESELCKSLGAEFRFVFVDLVPDEKVGKEQPATIKEFLEIMDNPKNYPVLFHCKAGLHRTGVLAALYRMEYQGWSSKEAWHELRANGFGDFVSDRSNPQVNQYVLSYQPRSALAKLKNRRPVPAILTNIAPSTQSILLQQTANTVEMKMSAPPVQPTVLQSQPQKTYDYRLAPR